MLDSSDDEGNRPKKLDLDEADQGGFQINEKFAERFEHNQKRKELEGLKAKHGDNPDLWEQESYDSENGSEDSDAQLLTSKAEKKFATLLSRIKNKDKTLLETEGDYFKESDFEESDDEKSKRKKGDKKKTLKDVIREDALRRIDEDDSDGSSDSARDSQEKGKKESIFQKSKKGKGETVAEEQARLKAEFKQQADAFGLEKKSKKKKDTKSKESSSQASSAEDDFNSDDDILVKKAKDGASSDSDVEGQDSQIIEPKKSQKAGNIKLESDKDVLNQLYGGDQDLDKTDRFLRDFILKEGWKANTMEEVDEDHYQKYRAKKDKMDDEDEERDSEMDKYEQQYNFRYEEKNSAYLTTHGRQAPEDSMRRVDDKRKQSRLDAKARKEEEKLKRKEEINKLKALKRDEIMEKLKKAEYIAGKFGNEKKQSKEPGAVGGILKDKRLLEKAEKELQTEFIPDLYDKTMDVLFDAKYYDASDDDKGLEDDREIDMQLLNDRIDDIGAVQEDSEGSLPDGAENIDEKQFLQAQKAKKQRKFEEQLGKSLKKQVDDKEVAEGYDSWFACDECHKAIPAGHYRFDCMTCDNFSFCERCYRKNSKHLHKFKRAKVPAGEGPPANADELLAKSYMLCSVCKDCLTDTNKRVYICQKCSPNIDEGDALYWCKKCNDETEHEHQREKFKGLPGLPETDQKAGKYLDNLLQEYYDLDCEDVIGGGQVKTRFRYESVPQEDFGLTTEEILLLDDHTLNKVVSMKKLRTYGHLDENGNPLPSDQQHKVKVNEFKIRKLKAECREEIELKRRLVRENLQANLQIEKEQYFGTSNSLAKKEKQKLKRDKKAKKEVKYTLLGKNKKDKDGEGDEDKDSENKDKDNVEQVDDEDPEAYAKASKKRRRMAQYGIKN